MQFCRGGARRPNSLPSPEGPTSGCGYCLGGPLVSDELIHVSGTSVQDACYHGASCLSSFTSRSGRVSHRPSPPNEPVGLERAFR